jgi:hypothetical protein
MLENSLKLEAYDSEWAEVTSWLYRIIHIDDRKPP